MFSDVVRALRQAERIAIFSHTHPDGDAMGSAYALKLALCAIGKKAEVFLEPEHDREAWQLLYGKEACGLQIADCDLLVALDCADQARLNRYSGCFQAHGNTIALDHHVTHRPFAKNGTVVAEISSTCELLYGLLKEMGIPLTLEIANNLYIGIVSDTGNFKYSSVTPATHRVAAELLEYGVDFAAIAKALFDTKTFGYLQLLQTALSKLQLYLDGTVAVLYLSEADFAAAQIDEQGAVGIVSLPNSVEGVEVGAYIRARGEGTFKVSLRSNTSVDVSAVAAAFGGGGHVRASGYSVSNTTVAQIIQSLLQEIQNYEAKHERSY